MDPVTLKLCDGNMISKNTLLPEALKGSIYFTIIYKIILLQGDFIPVVA